MNALFAYFFLKRRSSAVSPFHWVSFRERGKGGVSFSLPCARLLFQLFVCYHFLKEPILLPRLPMPPFTPPATLPSTPSSAGLPSISFFSFLISVLFASRAASAALCAFCAASKCFCCSFTLSSSLSTSSCFFSSSFAMRRFALFPPFWVSRAFRVKGPSGTPSSSTMFTSSKSRTCSAFASASNLSRPSSAALSLPSALCSTASFLSRSSSAFTKASFAFAATS
mmetsp:Transcript_11770/g.23347  ORF Transcript_11770/g.23347 Transcript_11770/m.23347 type:complete len:225 (-) Transcript_11770:1218-1892(-)